jgi:flagellar protein FlaI
MPEYLKDLIDKAKKAKKVDDAQPVATTIPKEPVNLKIEKKDEEELAKKLKMLDDSLQKKVDAARPTQTTQPTKTQTAKTDIPSTAADDATRKTDFEEKVDTAAKTQIASYGNVKIFKIEGLPLLHYSIPVPRPTASERSMVNTIKEAATRLISIQPYKIRDPVQRRNVYNQKIMEILKSSTELRIPETRFSFYAEAVVREMVGYGMIDQLVQDDKLEEIMVIGPRQPVYVFHRQYEMMTTDIEFYSDNEIEDLINKIAREVGRRVDISSPLLDARLADGSRVNATIPPASVSGSTLTIRKFKADPYTLVDLINYNTITTEAAAFLWACVEGIGGAPANILIAGGTGSGKTTLLNVLASLVPPRERIISIEDTAELNLPLQHWIRMEARPPGLEGKGEISIEVLTKNSLRMRPDRIIVGEVRHDEAFTLFTAMNTGHDGCLGTIHANSPQETIVRVTSPPMRVPEIMLSGLDLIIVEHRIHDRKKGTIRRVTEIAEVSGVLEGKAQTQTIFERNPGEDTLERTNIPSNYLKKIERYTGLTKKQIEAEIAEREKFLESLVKKNLKGMDTVSKTTQEYITEKGALNG